VTKPDNSACQGWTLLELTVVVAIMAVLLKISLPTIQNTILVYRLGAAAASAAAGIQQTRYQAIRKGCYYTIAFNAGSTTYHVQTQALKVPTGSPPGTPPSCATNADTSPNFTDATPTNDGTPAVVSWTSGGGVSLASSKTLEFGPSGIVGLPPSPATNPLTPCAPSCSFQLQLSHSNATRTVTISGVGNVKVTSP
jgi:prepilin-type N-terminal cleavage/methylation domain-containing protein